MCTYTVYCKYIGVIIHVDVVIVRGGVVDFLRNKCTRNRKADFQKLPKLSKLGIVYLTLQSSSMSHSGIMGCALRH
jgi:hypothetical protein